jgi:cytochrome c-type biogenesis protein CcmH
MILRLLALFLLLASPAWALQADELLPDPRLEARAVAIGQQLRCVVCQMESINDSPATLARDLRLLIRQKLHDGMDDAAIMAYVRDKYGDYVLLEPPLQGNTWLLWSAPALLFLLGAGLAFGLLRRGRRVMR